LVFGFWGVGGGGWGVGGGEWEAVVKYRMTQESHHARQSYRCGGRVCLYVDLLEGVEG